MTKQDTVEVSDGATRSPRTKGITITVRLFPEVHGAALYALARVPRGWRSARVIHLLTVGLMHEQAHGYGTAARILVSSPLGTDAMTPDAAAMRGEDLAFVSGVLEGPEL